jgi:hypothetical protein
VFQHQTVRERNYNDSSKLKSASQQDRDIISIGAA